MPFTYRVLTGPTAAGKTACLRNRAPQRPVAVVSADSRQVYQGMNVGTGTPDTTCLEILPHYVVNIVSPPIIFSVYQYLIETTKALRELEAADAEVWVCGGTGLYIRGLLERLPLRAGPRPMLRESLYRRLEHESAAEVATALQLDLVEIDNPSRVVRCCEAACQSEESFERFYLPLGLDHRAWESDNAAQQPDPGYEETLAYLGKWRCLGIAVLDPGLDELSAMIEIRVRAMFENGLLDEVRQLELSGFADAQVVRDGIAYREALAVIQGRMELEEGIQLAMIRTRQYAKRQRTYFRGQGWPVYSTCNECFNALGCG